MDANVQECAEMGGVRHEYSEHVDACNASAC